jgi:hypothetical protein
MKESDILDEAPTHLWIRPEPPANSRRRPPPVPKRRSSPHIVRRRQPTEPAVAPNPMSGRSCMLNLVDELGALAAELHMEGKLDAIPELDVDEEPTDA